MACLDGSAGAGEVKSMDTPAGKRKPPKRWLAGVANGAAWAGWVDSEPAGWKTAALPLPQAVTPASTLMARTAGGPHRPRMVPPWPPESQRPKSAPVLTQIYLISY